MIKQATDFFFLRQYLRTKVCFACDGLRPFLMRGLAGVFLIFWCCCHLSHVSLVYNLSSRPSTPPSVSPTLRANTMTVPIAKDLDEDSIWLYLERWKDKESEEVKFKFKTL